MKEDNYMRVGIFVELYRPYLSGVVISLERLMTYLSQKNHQFVIFTPEVPGYQDKDDFEVIRLPSFGLFGQRFAKPFLNKELEKKIKECNLDLIHIQGPYPTGILGVKAAKKLGLPLIMTYHAHVLFYLKSWLTLWNLPFNLIAQFFSFLLIRWISGNCQLIIAPSNFIKRVLRGYGIKTRIEVLPTPLQFPQKKSEFFLSRKELGLPEKVKILLYVGRLSKEKNIKMLLSAFEKVVEERKSVILVLAGSGPFQKDLEKIVKKKKLNDFVFFLGRIDHEKIWSLLRNTDIFVFPSLSETQGLSVAEAMLAGLPVIVAKGGGAPEFIENRVSGLICDNDPAKFAFAILSLLDNQVFRAYLGKNAQKKIVNDLNPDLIYGKLEKIYLDLVKSP
jgi:glycosyltransferase involved in cell wall biosynthesis